MKKVLVLGASGAMGRYVVPELAKMGHEVDAVSLDAPDPALDPPGVRRIQGNAKEEAFLAPLLARNYDGIVDFMIYPTGELANKLPRMAASTGHYVYLSSYRVYDGKDVPVREDSRLLLDTADDPLIRFSDDYSIYKARGEYLLRGLGRRNWTIVRPSITFSTYRYQLVTLEAPLVVGRTDCGLKAVWAPEEDFLRIIEPNPWYRYAAWQLRTDRLFDRVIDNAKVLAATGLAQNASCRRRKAWKRSSPKSRATTNGGALRTPAPAWTTGSRRTHRK